jgi:hypothetical protein
MYINSRQVTIDGKIYYVNINALSGEYEIADSVTGTSHVYLRTMYDKDVEQWIKARQHEAVNPELTSKPLDFIASNPEKYREYFVHVSPLDTWRWAEEVFWGKSTDAPQEKIKDNMTERKPQPANPDVQVVLDTWAGAISGYNKLLATGRWKIKRFMGDGWRASRIDDNDHSKAWRDVHLLPYAIQWALDEDKQFSLADRVAELEAENAALRARLDGSD